MAFSAEGTDKQLEHQEKVQVALIAGWGRSHYLLSLPDVLVEWKGYLRFVSCGKARRGQR